MFMLHLDQRWRVIYYSLLTTVLLIMIVVLKMAYEQDRPNWLDTSITIGEFDCDLEYGNPSGHSFEAAATAFAIYLDSLFSMG